MALIPVPNQNWMIDLVESGTDEHRIRPAVYDYSMTNCMLEATLEMILKQCRYFQSLYNPTITGNLGETKAWGLILWLSSKAIIELRFVIPVMNFYK